MARAHCTCDPSAIKNEVDDDVLSEIVRVRAANLLKALINLLLRRPARELPLVDLAGRSIVMHTSTVFA